MKNFIVTMLLALGLAATGSSVMAAQPDFIPWTFDDFDHNDNLIEATKQQPAQASTKENLAIEMESGELGW